MRFFLDFLHQKVPRDRGEIPAYYSRALMAGEVLQAVYFLVCFFLFPVIIPKWEWIPLLFIAGTGLGLWAVKHANIRINMALYALICCGWVFWNVMHFGWGTGVQHFLTLMVMLIFFNVYDRPVLKICRLILILAFRIVLFCVSTGIGNLDAEAGTIYQTVNTVAFFLMLACMCIIFSTSIQDTERQLRLKNQILYKEAGTDPLTGLPNRRAMVEQIEQYYRENGGSPFSVAIADIDYFKEINDTYGHSCGDYTLVRLTELFAEHSKGRFTVCRWGGEEFCFFIPGANVDDAGVMMKDLCFAVEKMPLEFEGHSFSITITIGVEEYDFISPMEELLELADEKLYMGKKAGRNRVVV